MPTGYHIGASGVTSAGVDAGAGSATAPRIPCRRRAGRWYPGNDAGRGLVPALKPRPELVAAAANLLAIVLNGIVG